MIFGFCRPILPGRPIPPISSWRAAHALGQTHVRITVPLPDLFPTPTKTNFDALDQHYDAATESNITVVLDPLDCPAWASEGVAVYVAGIKGSSAWVLGRHGVPQDRFDAIYAVAGSNDVRVVADAISRPTDHPPGTPTAPVFNPESVAIEFLSHYHAEFGGSQCWADPLNPNDPRQPHQWGDVPALDKWSAPRPRVRENLPHVDPKAMAYFGETIGARYPNIKYHMLGNEWDIHLSYPPMRIDGANVPGGPDTVLWIMDEWYEPYFTALSAAVRRVSNSLDNDAVRFIGPGTAYPGTLPRFSWSGLFDILDGHMYGSGEWPLASYAHVDDYAEQFRRNGRPCICGEINGPPVVQRSIPEEPIPDPITTSIVEWTEGVIAKKTPLNGIFYLDESLLIPNWEEGGTDPSSTGQAMAAVYARLNTRRRAAWK